MKMQLYAATITLYLVMDSLGNIPIFLSALHGIKPKRQRQIILRESIIAFFILTAFLFFGQYILSALHVTMPALGIAGGIILFLIAVKMIFPPEKPKQRRRVSEEPFIVPMAIPLTAGPSAIATVMLFASHSPEHIWMWFFALLFASILSTLTVLFSPLLMKALRRSGLIALERLMGMVLTTIAVQMFLQGIKTYFST